MSESEYVLAAVALGHVVAFAVGYWWGSGDRASQQPTNRGQASQLHSSEDAVDDGE